MADDLGNWCWGGLCRFGGKAEANCAGAGGIAFAVLVGGESKVRAMSLAGAGVAHRKMRPMGIDQGSDRGMVFTPLEIVQLAQWQVRSVPRCHRVLCEKQQKLVALRDQWCDLGNAGPG